MEFLYTFIFLFVLFFAVFMVTWLIASSNIKKKKAAYQAYINQNFPALQNRDFLMAYQVSQKINPTIVLAVDDSTKQIYIFMPSGKKGFTQKIYPEGSLRNVYRTFRIISKGAINKTHIYEECLMLTFSDNVTYNFITWGLSNAYGTTQGADIVRNIIAPWEAKMRSLLPVAAPPPVPAT